MKVFIHYNTSIFLEKRCESKNFERKKTCYRLFFRIDRAGSSTVFRVDIIDYLIDVWLLSPGNI